MIYTNLVILQGNLGGDAELKYTPSQKAVMNFSLATTESYKDKSGEWQKNTHWHRIVAWNKLAETYAKHCIKGAHVQVVGKLVTREWEKDGEKRYITEVIAKEIRVQEYVKDDSNTNQQQNTQTQSSNEPPPYNDDDLPF